MEKLSTIKDVRQVLREEIRCYNWLQVHSTTGEIPDYSFEKGRKKGQSLFQPFLVPEPIKSTKDVF